MDALDRLLRRLVQNITASHPEYLTRPFEVAELYQVLVPYRLNRRELELDTNQDYEFTVMQLLAGERGYLVGDAEMQEALRKEVASPNPDTGAFRHYASAQVALSPEIVRRLDARRDAARQQARDGAPEVAQAAAPDVAQARMPGAAPEPPPPRPAGGLTVELGSGYLGAAPPAAAEVPDRAAAVGAGGRREAGEAPGAAPLLRPFTVADVPRGPGAPAPGLPPQPMQPAQPTQPAPTYAAPPAAPGDDARGALSPNDEMMQTPRPPKTITGGGPCPYCGGALPDGRRITFCPHCGHNLTVHYCPACSTELEPDWRFCTTCGREQTVGATQ